MGEIMGLRRIFAGVLLIALAGCQTEYKEQTFRQGMGVAAEAVTSTMYRVRAFGNIYDDKALMTDYVMLKAAETTHGRGATHFVIVSANDLSFTQYSAIPGIATSTFSGGTLQTVYTPSTVMTTNVPRVEIMIEIGKFPPGTTPPPGAINAAEIINVIGPRVKSKKKH
jgi:hypothetical protein